MPIPTVTIRRISRHPSASEHDSLELLPGVNILVGEGNTGKTKWLESIDYILGDEPSAEQRKEDDIFSSYDSISAELTIGNETLQVERRWKETGGVGKVYVNGDPMPVDRYCDLILRKLSIPPLHYPQGDPYGSRKWPLLGWRSLMRHIYRREDSWTDFADRQPVVEQHACLTQFLGIAERLFSSEYGDMVAKNKNIWDLEARRDQFMSMLDEISRELIHSKELGVGITPESIAGAKAALQEKETELLTRKERFLHKLRDDIVEAAAEKNQVLPDIDAVTERLVKLEADTQKVVSASESTVNRIDELHATNKLLLAELDRLARAQLAGEVLADLRVTNCPHCDQTIQKQPSNDRECYVCGQEFVETKAAVAKRRLEFETDQLKSEVKENQELLDALTSSLANLNVDRQALEGEIASLRAQLSPVRKAAAAVLPPELAVVDIQIGALQEKTQQLSRVETLLGRRETLAQDILRIQGELADLERAVQERSNSVDFEAAGDRLRDGMVTYLNRILVLKPDSWLGSSVSVRIAERSFRMKVAEGNWRTKLGATQKVYFLLAYDFGLMALTRMPESHFPGFLMLDFPAKVEDGTTIADKENFIIEPLVELLHQPGMEACQVIAAGRSFKDLKQVNRIPFTKVWKA